jgi:type IV pilus assembly protein PilA
MKTQHGFSLIELLIVVAIILIIAGIAIPNLLKARISANESSAVGSIRALTTANIQYFVQCPAKGFAVALTNLGPGDGSCAAIDEVLVSGTKSGYSITYTPGAPNAAGLISTYTILVKPITVSVTGQRAFCSSQDGVIHYNQTGTTCDATPAGDPSLQ